MIRYFTKFKCEIISMILLPAFFISCSNDKVVDNEDDSGGNIEDLTNPVLKNLQDEFNYYYGLFDSLEINLKEKDSVRVQYIYGELGEAQRKSGNYSEAIIFLKKALDYSKPKYKLELSRIYLGLSSTHYEIFIHQPEKKNLLDTSFRYAEKSLELSLKLKDSLLISSGLNLIGAANIHRKNYSSALHFLKKAYVLSTAAGKSDLSAMLNIAYLYNAIRMPDSALFYANEAYILSVASENIIFIGISLERLTEIYSSLGDLASARKANNELVELKSRKGIYLQSMFMKQLMMSHEQKAKNEIINDLNNDKFFLLRLNWLLVFALSALIIAVILVFYLLRQKKRLIRSEHELHELNKKQDALKIENMSLEMKNLEWEKKSLIQSKEYSESVLANKLISMTQLESFLLMLQDEINERKRKLKNQRAIELFNEVEQLITRRVKGDMWQDFELIYKSSKSSFGNVLEEKHPDLTANEKRLCYLIAMNLTTKEIANISHKTYRSVEMARFRLRKKFNLEKDEDLYGYLNSLVK